MLLLFICAAALSAAEAPPSPPPEPATVSISGYGFFGNRQLRKSLKILETEAKPPAFYTASYVEDAVLILFSRLNRDGFLNPRVTTRLTLEGGRKLNLVWTQAVETPLPNVLRIQEARFKIKPGVRYHYDDLEFEGLETVPVKKARSFFIETGALLPLRRYRIYNPLGLRRGLDNLTEVLQRQGYEQAEVKAEDVVRNERNGNVSVRIRVREGPKSLVRSIREEVFYGQTNAPDSVSTVATNVAYSRLWAQDFRQALRTNYFPLGYPDTEVQLEVARREPTNGLVHLDLLAKIQTGPRIHVGTVRFEGNKRTKLSVMKKQVPVKPGELLDRSEAERGRLKLARLGAFQSVDLRYDPVDARTRNVEYLVRESRRIDVSLLFGYGSYEMLRGGMEVDQFNVFGRAHQARLKLIQSFKASNVSYNYTMPELLGEDLDVFFESSFLRREEIDFLRLEYGGGVGVRRAFREIATDVDVRYDYSILNASAANEDFLLTVGPLSPGVSAFSTNVRHDRRDNPLYPTKGYKVFGNFEIASEYFASDVNYQRADLNGSYHLPIGGGRRFHFGLAHGVVGTIGDPREELPFNRRFFPGGENSIRGYQQGEAAPRNAEGKIIGAQTYSFGSTEFEQSLTRQWSLVGFFDSVGFARNLRDYPWDEGLFAAGGGVRWRTVIGPVRLEYGRNLNPRAHDPSGTLHFSFGFPF